MCLGHCLRAVSNYFGQTACVQCQINLARLPACSAKLFRPDYLCTVPKQSLLRARPQPLLKVLERGGSLGRATAQCPYMALLPTTSARLPARSAI